jgi:hypothetical protein
MHEAKQMTTGQPLVQLHTRPVDSPPPCEAATGQYRVGLISFESGRVLVFMGRLWVLEPDEWDTFKSGS